MNRLHPSTLGELNDAVNVPQYDRAAMHAGIVHLGVGAFHRAHQAVLTDAAMAASGGDWGIIGVSLRSADVSRQLLPQGGLYSLQSEDESGRQLQVVGAILDVLVAPQQPAAVAAAIADQRIHLVTLTITEKGYSLAADGCSLDRSDPLIHSDLQQPQQPQSAVGLLALGLQQRMATGGAPLTILSCDNIAENSRRLRVVLVEYLSSSFPEVLPWLDTATAFPCSMVDRIVPAMSAARRQQQAEALGVHDEGAVSTEPFCQWIIEDHFAAGHPDWERAGARLVVDIVPYENIKLRLLNASHSAIAYCGLLAGAATVDEVMQEPALRSFVERLMTEDLMPALPDVPDDFDLSGYQRQLLQRFNNPCLAHRCAQIAMDGSEKIFQRWLPALQNSAPPQLLKALAAWSYFILCTDHVVDDPRRAQLLALRASGAPLAQRVEQLLASARISPATTANFPALRDGVEQGVQLIGRDGVSALLAA